MDINGNKVEYSANNFSVSSHLLAKRTRMISCSRESVEALHGIEKVQAVYEKAKSHVREFNASQTYKEASKMGADERERLIAEMGDRMKILEQAPTVMMKHPDLEDEKNAACIVL
jgi:hypothetical protein